MTESYIIPEFDENGNFLSDDVKARIVEMIESHIVPEFDENGNILRDDVKARIVEMIEAHAPTPVPSNPGPEIITVEEGHPDLAGTLAEPLPDDLPVGSYLINEPRFMGYRLSQKTPFGWDIKDFEWNHRYSYPSSSTGLRAWVMRGDTPIGSGNFWPTVTVTADSLHIGGNSSGMSFTKGEVVKMVLEGPQYDLAERIVVSRRFERNGPEGPEIVSHLLSASTYGATVEGEHISGLVVEIVVGRDESTLWLDATFGLKSAPDVRATDETYVPPSERVEVEVPEPTFVEADDHSSCTVTIPEAEGVNWRLSFQYADAEPGVYEVRMEDRQHFSVSASAKKGYYIKNDDATGVPWRTAAKWDYSLGIPVTIPMPEPLNAATENGQEGWIVRYPEVEHASYYFTTGMGPHVVKTVLAGDVFTPLGRLIQVEVTGLPYYPTPSYVGRLQADGTIS